MKRILLFVGLILLSSSDVFTCWYEGEYGYSFFDKEIAIRPDWIYFIDYQAGLGNGLSTLEEKSIDGNLVSWKNYLNLAADNVDLAELIYKQPAEDLQALLDNKKALHAAAKNHSVFALWVKKKRLRKSMGNYLLYAKACVKKIRERAPRWDKTNKQHSAKMRALIEEGKVAYKKERSPFIKERYAFQILRLHFYLRDHDQILASFNKYFAQESTNPSYIYYRALELKAGALFRQKPAEAPYLYAKVFANCPDRRKICLNSFSFSNQEEWDKSFNFCKTNEERVVYFCMRGLQPHANMIEEIANIVAIAPASPFAELLLCRYITRVQKKIFPLYYSEYEYQKYPRTLSDLSVSLEQLNELCQMMLKNKEIENIDFWKVSSAYLELMNQNTLKSMALCTDVDRKSPYYQQAQTIRLVAQICDLKNLTQDVADAIWESINQDEHLKKNHDLHSFMESAFARLYYNQKDYARAFLTQNNLTALNAKLDLSLLKDLDEFIKNTDNYSVYDRYLLSEKCGATALDDIAQMQGIYYLQHNRLDKAISYFEKLSANYKHQNPYFNNPYLDKTIWVTSITPPVFYKDVAGQEVEQLYKNYPELDLNRKFNLLTFTQKLKELEQKARWKGQKAAEYYYLLGVAWYNISPGAWSRPAIYSTLKNHGLLNWIAIGKKEVRSRVFSSYDSYDYVHRYFDPDIGCRYLDKAMRLSNDPELKAKACYLAALLQKVETEESAGVGKTVNFKKYMQQLKDEYANTKYYQEVIKECYLVRNW